MPKTIDGITRFKTLQGANEFACDDDFIEMDGDDWLVVTPTSVRGRELKDWHDAVWRQARQNG